MYIRRKTEDWVAKEGRIRLSNKFPRGELVKIRPMEHVIHIGTRWKFERALELGEVWGDAGPGVGEVTDNTEMISHGDLSTLLGFPFPLVQIIHTHITH